MLCSFNEFQDNVLKFKAVKNVIEKNQERE